jgi:O-antigen/teichoic acid export membrane protein
MKSSITSRLIKLITTGALIFYIFSGVSSVLNYAFYPIIARFVSVGEYGEIQFLVSMFTQLAVGFVVLNILAIIIGVELKDPRDQRKAAHSLNVVAGTVTTCIVIIGSSILLAQKATLGLTSTSAIIALGLSLLINVPFTVAVGRLQGNGMFMASGVVSMLGALFKLAFSLLFVVLGYGVAGAIFGIFIGMAVSLVVIEVLNYLKVKQPPHFTFLPTRNHLAQLAFIKKRAVVALVSITVITLLSAADGITSRIILTSTQAGQYAAIATVAKMILAVTSPLMWLALPPAIQRDKKRVFRYVIIALCISLGATLLFSLAPNFFTMTIIGVEAKSYISLLSLASIGMTLCATAFILLTTAVCLGYLKRVLYTTLIVIVIFFTTMIIISSISSTLVAALYAQVAASLCFIVALTPKLLHIDTRR